MHVGAILKCSTFFYDLNTQIGQVLCKWSPTHLPHKFWNKKHLLKVSDWQIIDKRSEPNLGKGLPAKENCFDNLQELIVFWLVFLKKEKERRLSTFFFPQKTPIYTVSTGFFFSFLLGRYQAKIHPKIVNTVRKLEVNNVCDQMCLWSQQPNENMS